jgi:hypothetical protein
MYPVSFAADYAERRSRLTTFFRLILAIPHIIVLYVWGIVTLVLAVIAWFAIVITARYPSGLYGAVSRFVLYATQVMAYLTFLTDAYPGFGGSTDYPVRMTFAGPLDRYSRLKTGFRFILAHPAPGPALRRGDPGRGRSGLRLVRRRHHRPDAARAAGPAGAGRVLHGA